jgi:hypothetical protein
MIVPFVASVDQPNPDFILPVVHTRTYNGEFRNPADPGRNTLLVELREITRMIESGKYLAAINKLENDVSAEADGCLGGLEGDDWIVACDSLARVSSVVNDPVSYLELLY